MLPFSVEVEGLTKEGEGKWVLEIDIAGERLLIVHEDKSLHWHAMAECIFRGMIPPNAPQPMMLVEPQPQGQEGPTLFTPNRQARRHPLENGPRP